MHHPSAQRRLFLIGYTRAYRLELCEAFREQGYHVTPYADMRLAEYAIREQGHPDLVLTDWLIQDHANTPVFIDRYAALFPVLVHSVHDLLIDVVQSLRAGAQDYIRQPCYFPELLARLDCTRTKAPATQRLTVGPVTLDTATGIAHIGPDTLHMTPREASILAALLQCAGQAVPRQTLLHLAGIRSAKPTIIESYIKQLRKRHLHLRATIHTRYGRGYGYFPG